MKCEKEITAAELRVGDVFRLPKMNADRMGGSFGADQRVITLQAHRGRDGVSIVWDFHTYTSTGWWLFYTVHQTQKVLLLERAD